MCWEFLQSKMMKMAVFCKRTGYNKKKNRWSSGVQVMIFFFFFFLLLFFSFFFLGRCVCSRCMNQTGVLVKDKKKWKLETKQRVRKGGRGRIVLKGEKRRDTTNWKSLCNYYYYYILYIPILPSIVLYFIFDGWREKVQIINSAMMSSWMHRKRVITKSPRMYGLPWMRNGSSYGSSYGSSWMHQKRVITELPRMYGSPWMRNGSSWMCNVSTHNNLVLGDTNIIWSFFAWKI